MKGVNSTNKKISFFSISFLTRKKSPKGSATKKLPSSSTNSTNHLLNRTKKEKDKSSRKGNPPLTQVSPPPRWTPKIVDFPTLNQNARVGECRSQLGLNSQIPSLSSLQLQQQFHQEAVRNVPEDEVQSIVKLFSEFLFETNQWQNAANDHPSKGAVAIAGQENCEPGGV